MIALSWWNRPTAITTQPDLALFPFSPWLSSLTDLSVHCSDERENLKMLPPCASQLKVMGEHQVNIHRLASTVRNLINMSSGCLLTVSFNALPTQWAHAHENGTGTHTRTLHARTWHRADRNMCTQTHTWSHTPTQCRAKLAEELGTQQRRQAEPK